MGGCGRRSGNRFLSRPVRMYIRRLDSQQLQVSSQPTLPFCVQQHSKTHCSKAFGLNGTYGCLHIQGSVRSWVFQYLPDIGIGTKQAAVNDYGTCERGTATREPGDLDGVGSKSQQWLLSASMESLNITAPNTARHLVIHNLKPVDAIHTILQLMLCTQFGLHRTITLTPHRSTPFRENPP